MKPISILAILMFGLLCTTTSLADDPPEQTHDGLKRVDDSKMDLAYVHPDADFSHYAKVAILEPEVAFRKNWERDQRRSSVHRIDSRDIERIKTGMAELFMEVFTQALEEGGYPIVEVAGEDVLIMRPGILNLDVAAPDVPTAGRSRSYTTSAGSASLVVEFYDSVTGQILGRGVDHKRARDTHNFQWANSVSNRSEARRILRQWAEMLVERLDEVHGK